MEFVVWYVTHLVPLLLLAIAAMWVFGAPLALWRMMKCEAHPNVQRVNEGDWLPSSVRKQFSGAGEELVRLGFAPCSTVFVRQPMRNLIVICSVYLHRKNRDVAVAYSTLVLVDDQWNTESHYVAFNSRFENGFEINTLNALEIGAFKTPKDVCTTFVPWIKNLELLYKAHAAILAANAPRVAKDFQLDTEYDGDCVTWIAAGIRHELESAREDGYLRLDDDGMHYSPTPLGGYLMVWRHLFPFKSFVVTKKRRQARKRLEDVGFVA